MFRRNLTALSLASLLLCVLIGAAYARQAKKVVRDETGTSTSQFQPLHVEGNSIVNARGERILLRGVNIIDPQILGNDGYFTEGFFAYVAGKWKANVIRVPIYPKSWSSSYVDDYLVPLCRWAEKYQVYLIFDYHAFGNPADHIIAIKGIWNVIASRFNDYPFILFDLFNEPDHITWDNWRQLAEDIIDTIRIVDKNRIVLVGGINNGYSLKEAFRNPVKRPNIVYSTHPYPIKAGPWEIDFGYLAQTYPVFAGEWGFSDERKEWDSKVYYIDPNGAYKDYGRDLIKYFTMKGIHWTAWVMHPYWRPNLISDWSYTPTVFGRLVKDALNSESDGPRRQADRQVP